MNMNARKSAVVGPYLFTEQGRDYELRHIVPAFTGFALPSAVFNIGDDHGADFQEDEVAGLVHRWLAGLGVQVSLTRVKIKKFQLRVEGDRRQLWVSFWQG